MNRPKLLLFVAAALLASCRPHAECPAYRQITNANAGATACQRTRDNHSITVDHAKATVPAAVTKKHGPSTPMMLTKLQDAPLLDIFDMLNPAVVPTNSSPSLRVVLTQIGYTPVLIVPNTDDVSRVTFTFHTDDSKYVKGSSVTLRAQFWQSHNRAAVWDPFAGFLSVDPEDWGAYRHFHDYLNGENGTLTVTVTYRTRKSWTASFARREPAPATIFASDFVALKEIMTKAKHEVEFREASKLDNDFVETSATLLLQGETNLYEVKVTLIDGNRRRLCYDTKGVLLNYSHELTFPNPMSIDTARMWEQSLIMTQEAGQMGSTRWGSGN